MSQSKAGPGACLVLTCLVVLSGPGCGSEGGSQPADPQHSDTVLIPAGNFLMGSAEEEIRAIHASYGGARALYEAEFPQRDVYLGAFYIDKSEVTNAKYKVFIESTGRAPPVVEREWAALYNWSAGSYPDGMADHPVVLVSFDDAEAYCEWAGQSLPSEAQWEKAARGAGGKNYPWGDQWDSSKLNSAATWSDHELPTIEDWTDWWRDVYNGELRARVVTTQPVGAYPAGASPFGVLDMAGNVFEWTRDWYQPYEGSHYENPEFGEMYRVIRGGDWYLDRIYTRTSARLRSPPDHRVPNIGFRCVCVHEYTCAHK